MTEELTYRELVERLGEPLTERHVAGTVGVQADNWPCGCLRIIRAREGEADIEFIPCGQHKAEFSEVTVL